MSGLLPSAGRHGAAKALLTGVLVGCLAMPPGLLAGSVSWITPAGPGSYADPTNWSGGVVPNNGADTFDVTVDVAGSLVNINTISPTINSLTTGFTSSVSVTAQSLTLGSPASGAGILNNGGTLNLNSGAQLTLDISASAPGPAPDSTNAGTITLAATAALSIDQGAGNSIALNLNGGGSIQMSGGTISGVQGSETLFTDNTISGAGSISGLQLNLNDPGTLRADGGVLSVSNLGNYDAASGSLNFGTYVTNANGAGGDIRIGNITGGISNNDANITLNGGGSILNATGTDALNGSLTINTGNLTLQNGASVTAAPGALENDGTITLNGGSASNVLQAQGFSNFGTLNVASGDIADFSAGTTLSSGTLANGTYNLSGQMTF